MIEQSKNSDWMERQITDYLKQVLWWVRDYDYEFTKEQEEIFEDIGWLYTVRDELD